LSSESGEYSCIDGLIGWIGKRHCGEEKEKEIEVERKREGGYFRHV
jgi:hypothetical protein